MNGGGKGGRRRRTEGGRRRRTEGGREGGRDGNEAVWKEERKDEIIGKRERGKTSEGKMEKLRRKREKEEEEEEENGKEDTVTKETYNW